MNHISPLPVSTQTISFCALALWLSACGTEPKTESETQQESSEFASPEIVAESIVPEVDVASGSDSLATLSEEEMLAEPPSLSGAETQVPEEAVPAISLAEAKRPLYLEVYSDRGYEDANGRKIHDVMEADYLYLSLLVEDAEGRPIKDIQPSFQVKGDSRAVPMKNQTEGTDEIGNYPFGIVGGKMGEQEVTVQAADASITFYLNVISLEAAGYKNLSEIEGALDWRVMMQAKIHWGEQMSAVFPESIAAKNGKTVKIAGFMMPLNMSPKQEHFIMTSNPPSCFYHIPGGPAGAVEVLASPAVEVRWDPIVLEGRFVALENSNGGALYQLHDAREIRN